MATSTVDGIESSIYAALDGNSVRLLKLYPGDANSEIHCDLSKHPVDEEPKYDALSYVWGSGRPDCHVVLDGRRVPIRKNLWRFLNHARRSPSRFARYLWIDALCINQADNAERTHQVGMMAKIFRSASCVVVWLGPAYGGSDQAMHLLNRSSSYWVRKERRDNFWASPLSASIVGLCARPYWQRLWVFQELAVARRAVFMCGDQLVPYLKLEQWLQAAASSPPTDSTWAKLQYKAFMFSPGPSLIRQATPIPALRQLLDLVLATKHLHCAEPRDKIYALLGIAEGGHLGVVPDYTTPLPVLLNQVLRNHHALFPPIDLDAVQKQCQRLGACFGDEGLLFSFCDDCDYMQRLVMETFPLSLEGSDISLWWARQYAHFSIQTLLLSNDAFDCVATLFAAVKAGSLPTVHLLLETSEVDVNTGTDTCTPLLLAVENRHHDIVKALMELDRIDVNRTAGPGFPPIVVATHLKDEVSMNLILQSGKVDFAMRDLEGHTPLQWALIKDDTFALETFLQYTNFDVADRHWLVLHRAIEYGSNNALKVLLKHKQDFMHLWTTQGQSLLHACVRWSNKTALKILLEYLEANDTLAGFVLPESLLPTAIENNDLPIVETLLEGGKLDRAIGKTLCLHPLQRALLKSDMDESERLISAGKADYELRDREYRLTMCFVHALATDEVRKMVNAAKARLEGQSTTHLSVLEHVPEKLARSFRSFDS